jgi:hypothetical protein
MRRRYQTAILTLAGEKVTRTCTKLAGHVLVVVTFAGALVMSGDVPSQASTATPPPVETASGINYNTPDPGVFLGDNHYFAFSTGPGLREFDAPEAIGQWQPPESTLSGGLPSWADSSKGIWDPDMIKTTSDTYVVYFAAALKNTLGNPVGDDAVPAQGARCIGTAEGSKPTGPFTADAAPLVCFKQYGPADDMDGDPGDRVRGQGVIGSSPVFVNIDNQQRLYLLYKTQADPAAGQPSTIRMVRLAADDGTTVFGDSHQLIESNTGSFADTIEAPSLIQHDNWFVLFVAKGNFDKCSYTTEYFMSQNIWGWNGAAATPFLYSSQAGICGPGTADVTDSEVSGQSRIFFNGWVQESQGVISSTPYPLDPGAPPIKEGTNAARVMYAGIITWNADGTPHLFNYLPNPPG